MRPIDEVLAAGRKYHEHSHAGEPDIRWLPLRRELEEWEAKLAAKVLPDQEHELREVRQLLGRGEPEAEEITYKAVPAKKQYVLDCKIREDPPKPRPASPAMRALMAACEAVASQLSPSPSFDITIRRGIEPFSIKLAREALAIARAELGEEAERG